MAKPISEWTRDDLEALLGSEETSNLEFKDGRSLLNEISKKNEIAKDVSAMANAAGGLIVYGIHERDSVAESIAGCPADHGKAEWFEQVINNNIEPKVQGVTIKRIDLPDDKLALVVEVPKATTFAPHQSKPHHAYFRRYNATIQPMLDHEVRDLMRRGSSPELYLRYSLIPDGTPHHYQFRVLFGNRSTEPALYSEVNLIFESTVNLERRNDGWRETAIQFGHDGEGLMLTRQFIVPQHMPIMKENAQLILSAGVIIHPNTMQEMGYRITTPGFFKSEQFSIQRFSGTLVSFDPQHITRPD